MTSYYITIDTEYSAGMVARKGIDCRNENFERSIIGKTPNGEAGILFQIDQFNRHGLRAIFFVDPMPALVWGVEAITDIVQPIVEQGHEVQLHIHTEWLDFAGSNNPVGARTGRNIKDFNLDEQTVLLDKAREILIAAGAPSPTAFRAGNYGANDDTLRALSAIGLSADSSHCPGIEASECDISLDNDNLCPVEHCGIIEFPIGCVHSVGESKRHYQFTALSYAELLEAARFSVSQENQHLVLVSHSFELLSRDRTRINLLLKRRFEKLCSALAKLNGLQMGTFEKVEMPTEQAAEPSSILPYNRLRVGKRLAEQALSNMIYGRS